MVPATPDHAVLEQVTVFPDTPVAGAKTGPPFPSPPHPHHLPLGTALGLHGLGPGPRWWSLQSRCWPSVGRRLTTLVQVLTALCLPPLPYLPLPLLVLVFRFSIRFRLSTWFRWRQIVTWSSAGNADPA